MYALFPPKLPHDITPLTADMANLEEPFHFQKLDCLFFITESFKLHYKRVNTSYISPNLLTAFTTCSVILGLMQPLI